MSVTLQPGERIIWQSVNAYSKDLARLRWRETVGAYLLVAFALVSTIGACILMSDQSVAHVLWQSLIVLLAVCIFAYAVMVPRGRLFRRINRIVRSLDTSSFVSCVITDRRVILFNNPTQDLVSLDRDDLINPIPEYSEHDSAVLFTVRSTDKRYLFITDDFVAPLRALGPLSTGATS